jgi:hypothetical protein
VDRKLNLSVQRQENSDSAPLMARAAISDKIPMPLARLLLTKKPKRQHRTYMGLFKPIPLAY